MKYECIIWVAPNVYLYIAWETIDETRRGYFMHSYECLWNDIMAWVYKKIHHD